LPWSVKQLAKAADEGASARIRRTKARCCDGQPYRPRNPLTPSQRHCDDLPESLAPHWPENILLGIEPTVGPLIRWPECGGAAWRHWGDRHRRRAAETPVGRCDRPAADGGIARLVALKAVSWCWTGDEQPTHDMTGCLHDSLTP
jgi:hypothetical protein